MNVGVATTCNNLYTDFWLMLKMIRQIVCFSLFSLSCQCWQNILLFICCQHSYNSYSVLQPSFPEMFGINSAFKLIWYLHLVFLWQLFHLKFLVLLHHLVDWSYLLSILLFIKMIHNYWIPYIFICLKIPVTLYYFVLFCCSWRIL